MHVIRARNVNYAWPRGVELLQTYGDPEDSRNGPVLRVAAPVSTVYERPCERVLLHPDRDANPFFHLIEALWMLAGRDDLRPLTTYVKTFSDFSDDGRTVGGAYGRRWRRWFPGLGDEGGTFPHHDQLDWAVRRLRANPSDRRVVIQMWDAGCDPHRADDGSKDVPCNLTALPYVSGGKLHLTVFCRSNDVVWGAYGANAVHFSVLLEYLAGRLGLPAGTYTQVSNNFHGYVKTLPEEVGWPWDTKTVFGSDLDPYTTELVKPFPLFHQFPPSCFRGDAAEMDAGRERMIAEDLAIFFEHGPVESATKARWPFLKRVAVPLALAHQHYRVKRGEDRYEGALEILERCEAPDWRRAAREWVQRRYVKFIRAQDGGAHAAAE